VEHEFKGVGPSGAYASVLYPGIEPVRGAPPQLVHQQRRPTTHRSAGSTDSNYRSACRARSPSEFIAKIGVAAEEADESKGWLAALLAKRYGDPGETQVLIKEADELTRIFTASHKTAKRRLEEKKRREAVERTRRAR
jgi:four helix bundle protein